MDFVIYKDANCTNYLKERDIIKKTNKTNFLSYIFFLLVMANLSGPNEKNII